MALTLDEKKAKLVEIREKEIEIELFDEEGDAGVAAIRAEYDFSAMNQEISDYTSGRTADKLTLVNELKTLKEELVAE